MSDDLDAPDLDSLGAALRTPPAADTDKRAATLRLAMENFDRLQGSSEALRPSQDRPSRAGLWMGVKTMLTNLNLRPSLVATTSVAALCLAVVILLPPGALNFGNQPGVNGDAAAVQDDPLASLPKPEGPADLAAAPVPQTLAEAQVPEQDALAPLVRREAVRDDVTVAAPPPAAAASAKRDALGQGTVQDYGAVAADEARDTEAPLAEGYLAETDTTRAQPEMASGVAPAPVDGVAAPREPNTEAFANTDANPVKVTAEEPVSTFSIDVDTASYAVIRQSLSMGTLPPPEAVRIEEMVNYFPYAYLAPKGDAPFATSVSVMPTPWNEGTRLVRIGLQGALPAIADRPALNLVFLIDTSGSMDEPNKLPLLKQSIALALSELRPEDQVAVVAYAGSAGEVLPPTAAGDRDTILGALDNLSAGGSTAGAEGIELAYQVAARMAGDGEVSRVLLATDGDFNVGLSDPAGLEAYVARQRETGIYLSVLGFGRGNLDDAVMQSLAQNGNGTAAYIDTLSEARKVLVDQLTGMLFPIADDVKIQVEWNPAAVAEYRLIGYETRALAREDFNNDRVDAGEIGAGHQVTAIYEVTAPGSAALRNDPLRYGTVSATDAAPSEIGFLRLRYKAPGSDTSTLIETPITGTEPATDEARFAAAVAGFGQLLQGSTYLGDWVWDDAIALALSGRGEDAFGYRAEAINLMRLAKSLDR